MELGPVVPNIPNQVPQGDGRRVDGNGKLKQCNKSILYLVHGWANLGLKVNKGPKKPAITATLKAVDETFHGVGVIEANGLNHLWAIRSTYDQIKKLKNLSGMSQDDTEKKYNYKRGSIPQSYRGIAYYLAPISYWVCKCFGYISFVWLFVYISSTLLEQANKAWWKMAIICGWGTSSPFQAGPSHEAVSRHPLISLHFDIWLGRHLLLTFGVFDWRTGILFWACNHAYACWSKRPNLYFQASMVFCAHFIFGSKHLSRQMLF